MAIETKRPTIRATRPTDVNAALLNAIDANGKRLNYKCSKCGNIKSRNEFFQCTSAKNRTGYSSICKECATAIAAPDGEITQEGMYELCKVIDKPYIERLYNESYRAKLKMPVSKISKYFNLVNASFKTQGFGDSEPLKVLTADEVAKQTTRSTRDFDDDEYDKDEAIENFGTGWRADEYKMLWKKYNLLLKNYPLRTEMHKEMLIKYVKYAIREELAVASGDVASAEKWGKLAASTAKDAKINPNQLSETDLNNGVTCFSELAAMVEKTQDVIPILPQFREEPKDRVDYTLWEYINYARHLQGLPLVKYSEIYDFLTQRYEELKKHYDFLELDKKGDFDNHNLGEE